MKNSNIHWTAHTWNPVWGCRKVSAGCKNCYAERLITGRYGQKFTDVRRTSNRTFNFPYQLHKKLTGNEPLQERLVFTCSMSDFFIEEADGASSAKHRTWCTRFLLNGPKESKTIYRMTGDRRGTRTYGWVPVPKTKRFMMTG